jgi:hypothetical protein
MPAGEKMIAPQAASYFAAWGQSVRGARALNRAMIGITISGKAYAAIAPTLPVGSAAEAEQEITPDCEYLVWLPRTVVNRLRALREPDETFSDVILRLAERGCYAAIAR